MTTPLTMRAPCTSFSSNPAEISTLSEADQVYVGNIKTGMMTVLIFGIFLALGAGIWLIVLAFGTSILWGILVLLVPLCDLIYTITHWSRAWRPFVMSLYAVIPVAGIYIFFGGFPF